jgi:hypothetical protein
MCCLYDFFVGFAALYNFSNYSAPLEQRKAVFKSVTLSIAKGLNMAEDLSLRSR